MRPCNLFPTPELPPKGPAAGPAGAAIGRPQGGHERGGELGGAHVAPPPNLEEWRNFAHNLPATELYK